MPPGTTSIAVTGSLRLAPAFVVGAAFRMVTGVDLAVAQRGQVWSSAAEYDAVLAPDVDEHALGLGPDLAVAIGVAVDPTEDVLDFLREQQIPVSRLLVLRPPGGAKDNAIPDAATASALAVGIRGLLRRACRTHPAIHLFQAARWAWLCCWAIGGTACDPPLCMRTSTDSRCMRRRSSSTRKPCPLTPRCPTPAAGPRRRRRPAPIPRSTVHPRP
ncbi:SAVED domain-containing protein [Streptomyces cathayae]|uniref:SAVED domain-containing protein n=1 Tax=Streptomyces cathayae TaxID=3031124 RepID=A0ABY8JXG3_9ACTN|nr:SAVED domain-containing protein [Streptomyces sp. HUAS 5]WGD38722.1 SAVED domain-containing protein [Streptomyces sp. HUAS 5]